MLGVIERDESGNIIIDETGRVTCTCEGGMQFTIPYDEIDFSCEVLHVTLDNKEIYIQIHHNNNNNNNNGSNNTEAPNKNTISVPNNEGTILRNIINDTTVSRNEPFIWTDSSTKLFLSLYKDTENFLSHRKIKTKKLLWKKIAEGMNNNGYNISVTQVENKFKSLDRSYKNTINYNKQTGRNRLSCPYETELNDILGGRHKIQPLCVSGNKGTVERMFDNNKMFLEIYMTFEDKTPIYQFQICYRSDCDTLHNEENTAPRNEIPTPSSSEQSTNVNDNIELMTENIVPTTFPNNQDARRERNSSTRNGRTAEILETCRSNLSDVSNILREESKERLNIMNNMLNEYKEMRKSWEEAMRKNHEQMKLANELRKQRNNLLQELLNKKDI